LIFISAGEVAGDRHGALLAGALRARCELPLVGLGGPAMAGAGVDLIADTGALGAVGLAEALPYGWAGWRVYRRACRWLRERPPHVAVLVDYPAVNVPLARVLRRLGVPVVYYLPPEEWTWSSRGNGLLDRGRRIAGLAHLVLAAHEREADAYRALGARVALIGHPLQDLMIARQPDRAAARTALGVADGERLVGLFPASRRQELRLVLPVLLAAAAQLARDDDRLRFALPVAAPFLAPAIRRAVAAHPGLGDRIRVVEAADASLATARVQAAADLALAKSGTVTLELALAGVAQVVVYRLAALTEWLGRHLLRLSEADFRRVSLPNLILDEDLLPELLQHNATPDAVAAAIRTLLDGPARARQLAGYRRLRARLGGPGAVDRAAARILELASAPPQP